MENNNIGIEDLTAKQQLDYGDNDNDNNWTGDLGTENVTMDEWNNDLQTTPEVTPEATPIQFNDDNKSRRISEEGFKPNIYTDTEGYLTVGIGHKLTKAEIASGKYKNGLTHEQAIKLYEEDEAREQGRLRKYLPSVGSLPKQAQGVLKDMAFNLGGNFLGEWKNFKSQIERGDYKGAAMNIRKSRYYKQVTNRAERNAKTLEELQT